MVKLLIELPEDLARWLARHAAWRGVSRQDLVLQQLRDDYERSLKVEVIADRGMQEHSELLRRLAEWPTPSQETELVCSGH